MTIRKSLVVQLITSKRSCTLVNCMSSSCFDSTEVGIVDADDDTDSDTDGDASDAMADREVGYVGCVEAVRRDG